MRLRRIMPLAPDRVFAAWTVPALMGRWLFVGQTSTIVFKSTEILLEISAVGAGSELAFTRHGVDPETVRGSWEMMLDNLERTCAPEAAA